MNKCPEVFFSDCYVGDHDSTKDPMFSRVLLELTDYKLVDISNGLLVLKITDSWVDAAYLSNACGNDDDVSYTIQFAVNSPTNEIIDDDEFRHVYFGPNLHGYIFYLDTKQLTEAFDRIKQEVRDYE